MHSQLIAMEEALKNYTAEPKSSCEQANKVRSGEITLSSAAQTREEIRKLVILVEKQIILNLMVVR